MLLYIHTFETVDLFQISPERSESLLSWSFSRGRAVFASLFSTGISDTVPHRLLLFYIFVANAFISPFNTQTMQIKSFYTQQHCFFPLITLYLDGIRTRVFLFLKRMRCPLRHAARAPHRLLLQSGSNTTMITRHHHHHFPTLSLAHLSLSLKLPT
jgi:hypothetical protein